MVAISRDHDVHSRGHRDGQHSHPGDMGNWDQLETLEGDRAGVDFRSVHHVFWDHTPCLIRRILTYAWRRIIEMEFNDYTGIFKILLAYQLLVDVHAKLGTERIARGI
jgi:hypothetical protein